MVLRIEVSQGEPSNNSIFLLTMHRCHISLFICAWFTALEITSGSNVYKNWSAFPKSVLFFLDRVSFPNSLACPLWLRLASNLRNLPISTGIIRFYHNAWLPKTLENLTYLELELITKHLSPPMQAPIHIKYINTYTLDLHLNGKWFKTL